MKEINKALELELEKNNKELNEAKQINMNLNQTIENMKLTYDIEITKYQNKINEYENKLNEIMSGNNEEEDE
jgi:CO dehydrogenase/acetyl-CoA synthase delta subunit